jgi:membrane protein
MALFTAERQTPKSEKTGSKKSITALLSETYTKWSDHNAPRLGASVAFYSILSFAPLLVLITAIIGLVFGHEHAQGALIGEARQVIGDRGADTVQTLLKNAQKPASGIIASTLAFITLLFGASGVFTELQDALNLMWDVKPQASSGVMGMVKQRLFSFGMVLSIGFLLLISLMLSAGLAFVGHSFGQLVPLPPFVLEIINFVVSFAVITGLFALMFKYVPDTKVSWKNVGIGAVGTALLFTIGKLLLGIYLGKAGVGSTYGAAGSLVAVVVWIYYSAQIFFFGAEFTHVYSERDQPAEARSAGTAESAQATAETEKEQTPVALAAAAGAGTGTSVTPPRSAALMPSPTPQISSPAPAPPRPEAATISVTPVRPIESVVVERPAAALPPERVTLPQHRTKPELLTSMAIGFLLGRMSGRLRKRGEVAGD